MVTVGRIVCTCHVLRADVDVLGALYVPRARAAAHGTCCGSRAHAGSASHAGLGTTRTRHVARTTHVIISPYAHRDRRRPRGVRAEAAPRRHATPPRTRGRRPRHAQRGAGRLPGHLRRRRPRGRRRPRRPRHRRSAAAARASRWPPTRSPACARRSATISTPRACRAQHNDANVLAIGGRIVAVGLADEILDALARHRRSRAAATSAASIRCSDRTRAADA